MALEFTTGLMDVDMRATGSRVNSMVKVNTFCLTVVQKLVSGSKVVDKNGLTREERTILDFSGLNS